jgi:hypothetical protein
VLVARCDVRRRARGGQDDHRDGLQLLVGLDRFERLAPVHPRHVQVEQDQVGAVGVLVRRGALQVIKRLAAVRHPVDRRLLAGALERLRDHQGVGIVVIDDEDLELPHRYPLVCSAASIGGAVGDDHSSKDETARTVRMVVSLTI